MSIHVPPPPHSLAEPPRGPGASLEAAGLAPQHAVHWNLSPAALYEHAVRRGEGVITEGGAFCAVTSPHTGRSPNDKFTVPDAVSAAEGWWGHVNQAMTDQQVHRLHAAVVRPLSGAGRLARARSARWCAQRRTR